MDISLEYIKECDCDLIQLNQPEDETEMMFSYAHVTEVYHQCPDHLGYSGYPEHYCAVCGKKLQEEEGTQIISLWTAHFNTNEAVMKITWLPRVDELITMMKGVHVKLWTDSSGNGYHVITERGREPKIFDGDSPELALIRAHKWVMEARKGTMMDETSERKECRKDRPCDGKGRWYHPEAVLIESDDIYWNWYKCPICGRTFWVTVSD